LVSITVAQRYSILVTARNDTSSNWVIHANMDTDMFDKVPADLNPNITSSITYNTSVSTPLQDLGTISAYHDVNDTALVPIPAIAQPTATKTIGLEFTFDTMDYGTNRAMFNGVTYNPPLVPAVFSELTLGANATVDAAYGPSSFVIEYGDVVDLVVMNGDVGKHPFHIHGHKIMIVGRSEDYTSSDPELNPPIVEGQANPIRRDTVQIPSGQSATLRVVADNPGVWIFHCHIEWHLEAGLAIQLIEAPLQAQVAAKATFPSVLDSHCAALDIPYTGNAAGHYSTTDLSGLKLGPYQQILGWRPKGIVAMTGCVLAAVMGILSVFWYTLGVVDDDVVEREVREKMEKRDIQRAERGKQLFGFRVRTVKD